MEQIILQNVAPKGTADAHYANVSNPHGVTKTQLGLGNADNTSDANKPVSTLQQAAIDLKQSISGLFSSVMSLVLTGFTAGANTAVAATDTLAQALAKIQGQINARPNETATTIATITNSTGSKATPVDADEVVGMDSENSFVLIKYSWTNIKAFLKTYFDTIYTTYTPVYCQLVRAAAQSLTSGASTQILLDTAPIDPGGIADLANNRIVVSETGTYLLGGSLGFTMQSGKVLLLFMKVNDIVVSPFSYKSLSAPAPVEQTAEIVSMLDLTAGDFITMWVFHNATTANTLTSLSSRPNLFLTKVS